MHSLLDQRIEAIPGATRKEAYDKIKLICVGRANRRSEHEIAKKARFGSVEAMYHQLKAWGLTGLLPPEKQAESTKPKTIDTKPKQKAHSSGQPEEVPNASAAAELFNDALDELTATVKMLEHLSLIYQGGASQALTRLRAAGFGRPTDPLRSGGKNWARRTTRTPTLKLSPCALR